jgi:organic radical activating enzyme
LPTPHETSIPGSTEQLPLMEDFYTLQGEGTYQGRAAYFIRLAGCDVGCVWCDVKESWAMDAHPMVGLPVLVQHARESGAPIAVITGGEPAMHNLEALTRNLRAAGMRTHIETSGAHPLTGEWDWICLSPKKFKAPRPDIYELAHELKIVVYNKSDLDWAEQEAARTSTNCRLYLQPEWSREKEMLPVIIAYVKKNPRWTVSLQVHKYMNIP